MHRSRIGEPPCVEAGAASSALAGAPPGEMARRGAFQFLYFVLVSTYTSLEPRSVFAVCAQPFCSPPGNANASRTLTAESRPYRLSLRRSSRPSRGLLSARYRIHRSPRLLELPISIVLTGLIVVV